MLKEDFKAYCYQDKAAQDPYAVFDEFSGVRAYREAEEGEGKNDHAYYERRDAYGNIYYGKLKGLYCTYPYSTNPDAFQLFIQK